MDASILIVGCDNFLTTLREAVFTLSASIIEVAPNPREAMLLIQSQQPDLLILQANQAGALELCWQIKSRSHLAWIYCILLEACDADSDEVLNLTHQRQVEGRIKALGAGADAYLWILLKTVLERNHKIETADLQRRLISAQVQTGLRCVNSHRELIRTNDLLSAIALSDPLTELNNRRAFEWELPRRIQNARTRDMPISLIMLDVDFFKRINDTYGHLVGDRSLQLLSARLRHNLRFYDTPFRYGGEEFVIILSDTSGHEADLIARRLCRLVGEQPFAINDSLDLKLTVSAGYASLQLEDDAKGTTLLQRADQNLLKAKTSGRNRVVGSEK